MQLTRALRTLALVAATLATITPARAQEEPPPELVTEPAEESPPTPAPSPAAPLDARASTQIAGYADTDHVYVISPTVAGALSNQTAGWSVDARYLIDIVSAASVDIVSTASRRWEEVRQVGSLGGLYKPGNVGVGADADVSVEPDYQSYTFGASVQQDLFSKNVTLLLGYNHAHDISGRARTPFSVFSHTIDHNGFKGGATFVLDKATLFSAVTDVILESGDTSKPYRYIPMFAPGTDVPRGASVVLVDALRTPARVLEQLPTKRGRYAASGHLAHRFARSTLRLSERLYTDSWGLSASSTDTRMLIDLTDRIEVGPHLRFHAQTPVAFWQRAYIAAPNFDFPALRTGDRELGPLMSVTGGGNLRIALGSAERLRAWVFGVDLNLTETRYLDDIYITSRLSAVAALSLEAAF